jgi:hypothetical protein
VPAGGLFADSSKEKPTGAIAQSLCSRSNLSDIVATYISLKSPVLSNVCLEYAGISNLFSNILPLAEVYLSNYTGLQLTSDGFNAKIVGGKL